MKDSRVEIVACPPELTRAALSLVLSEIAPEQRQEIAKQVIESNSEAVEGLYVARRDGAVCGASWGQRQPGNTGILWLPQWDGFADWAASQRLIQAVVDEFEASQIAMLQALLPSRNSDQAPLLEANGFRHLADLLYMTSESASFPVSPPTMSAIQLEPYDPTARKRLERLVERTYVETLDCAALNGARRTADVIDGYAATGVSATRRWHLLRSGGEDAGVLLLAEHQAPRYWELVYLGLVPEQRGRGLGGQAARGAQWMARGEGIERIVLAVDAVNIPAVRMYRQCGFETWDRRSAFVRVRTSI